jgi:anti-sigma factor RsiW
MNMDSSKLTEIIKKNKEELTYQMPSGLQKKLLKSVRDNNQESKSSFYDFLKITTGFSAGAVAACISFLIFSNSPSKEELIVQEIVSGHVRSMMVEHLSDVISTDQHTVKPWFEGKLDFSPAVKDLARQNFPLIGGRLDYINSRPVAALNYQHGKHLINVFEWPSSEASDSPPKLITRNGYQLFRWTKNGMNYWAISDLNAAELQTFVEFL